MDTQKESLYTLSQVKTKCGHRCTCGSLLRGVFDSRNRQGTERNESADEMDRNIKLCVQ